MFDTGLKAEKILEHVGAEPDDGEFFTVAEVTDMIERGEINDAKTVAAAYKYLSANK